MKPDVIAICGYIGSGKSQVAAILRRWGYKTVDCDQIAKEISLRPEVVHGVEQLLGEKYVSQGMLNRPLIRQRVFADSKLLNSYQRLFFGEVRKELQREAENTQDVLFVEIPVFDAFDFPWNGVWLVQCDKDELTDRVCRRDGVSANSVAATLSNQHPPVAPTLVIRNDGTLAELEQNIRTALRQSGFLHKQGI